MLTMWVSQTVIKMTFAKYIKINKTIMLLQSALNVVKTM